MNGFQFDLAAISFGLFLGAVTYLIYVFWNLAHPQRPVDWEIDYPEFRCAKESHLKVLK